MLGYEQILGKMSKLSKFLLYQYYQGKHFHDQDFMIRGTIVQNAAILFSEKCLFHFDLGGHVVENIENVAGLGEQGHNAEGHRREDNGIGSYTSLILLPLTWQEMRGS